MSGDEARDALGVRHPRAADDARIVSLVPSITELLFDLGLGAKVVGRTTFCVHPEKALAEVTRVGGTKKPRIDTLRALAPSHVIVNVDENRKEDVARIAEFVPHVIVTHPLTPDDNLELYALLGAIFACRKQAERLRESFRVARDALVEAAAQWPSRRVLYLIWRDPWMTVSHDTYISRTLALANWETVGDDAGVRYPEVRARPGLLADTDLVLFSSEPFPFKQRHLDEFRVLTGNDDTRFEFVDGEMTSWYGSRAIEGLRYLRDFAQRATL